MKLNHECVRKLLLEIEEKHVFNQLIRLNEFKEFETTKEFGFDTTTYALVTLRKENLVVFHFEQDAQLLFTDFWINGLTFDGHDYLDNIRSDKSWTAIKKQISDAGTEVGLSVVTGLALNYAKQLFGLN